MKLKEEYTGIGSTPSMVLLIGAAVSLAIGLFLVFSGKILSYSYGYYSRERDMRMAFGTAVAVALLLFGAWLFDMYFSCKKNQVCILSDRVQVQYRKLFAFKTARTTVEIPFSQIINVSEECQGVFGYVILTTAGEQHKVAIENAGEVRDSILKRIKK